MKNKVTKISYIFFFLCAFCVIAGLYKLYSGLSGERIPCGNEVTVKACFDKIFVKSERFRMPNQSSFEYLEIRKNAFLGTELTKVTEKGMFGDGDYIPLHRYSRRQAWNSDESLLDLGQGVVNANDYSIFLEKFPVSTERVWSHKDPKVVMGIRYDPKPTVFVRANLETLNIEEIVRFDNFEKCSIGEGEGNVSSDDRHVIFVCSGSSDERVMISFDLLKQREVGRMIADPSMNWVSVTPSGSYIVVENNGTEDPGEIETLTRYSLTFTDEKILTKDRNHGDLGSGADGQDVFVMIGDKRIRSIDIETAQISDLLVGNFFNRPGHGHVSCRNVNRPGWCYISANGAGVVGAVKINRSRSNFEKLLNFFTFSNNRDRGSFELWGFHNSESDSYESTPKASVSPSGKQIIFSSDWNGTELSHDYVINISR